MVEWYMTYETTEQGTYVKALRKRDKEELARRWIYDSTDSEVVLKAHCELIATVEVCVRREPESIC